MFVLVTIFILCTVHPASATAHQADENAGPTVSAYLDGEPLQFDVPPQIRNGSTMVPMRSVFEAFDTVIAWDSAAQTVTASKPGWQLQYTIGDQHGRLNGTTFQFASEPGLIERGRTLVPLRFVGEALGAHVAYEAQTRSVFIHREPNVGQLSILNRYRMTLPYHTLLDDAPFIIRFMQAHADDESYVFFGDSQTWGADLGRLQAHPYRLQQLLQTDTFNLGVPGFWDSHLFPWIQHALEQTQHTNVVIQLQWFWGGEPRSYTGFEKLFAKPLPAYEIAVQHLLDDLSNDVDVADPTPYRKLDSAVQKERIERGKQLFVPGETLDAAYEKRLSELREWMLSRPDLKFYIYIPPYFIGEIERHTDVSAAELGQRSEAIAHIFSEVPHAQFQDFNDGYHWQDDHFADWWHRTAAGEKVLATRLAQWLVR